MAAEKAGGRTWSGFSEADLKASEKAAVPPAADLRTRPVKTGLEIHILEGDDAGKTFPLETAEVVLGRRMFPEEKKEGWILFNEHTVSRMHAMLQWREGPERYRLVHKSTTNPTLVNGRIMQETILYPDDMIRIGDLTFQIRQHVDREEEFEDLRPNIEDRGIIYSGYKLAIIGGPDEGHQFILDHKVIHIGGLEARSQTKNANWIVLNDARLPREQAFLVWYEADHRYGIFHAGDSPVPTQISRVAHAPAAEGRGEVRNLLQVDDMVLLGDTVLLVLKHERFLETSKALQSGRELPTDDAAPKKRQPRRVSQGPHLPPQTPAKDDPSREIVDITKNTGPAMRTEPEKPQAEPKVVVKSAGPAHLGDPHPVRPATSRPATADAPQAWLVAPEYSLEFIEGPSRGERVELMASGLHHNRTFTIGGRGRRSNDVPLPGRDVPNEAAAIQYQNGVFTLYAAPGAEVYLNDVPTQVDILKNGDEIRVGPHAFVFIDRAAVTQQSQFEVYLDTELHHTYDTLPLDRDVLTIGRAKGTDIRIEDPQVAAVHARLLFRRDGYVVERITDQNPLFVNGVSLMLGHERLLAPGDEIQLSRHTRLRIRERRA
jgi:pSer/pThr/pTyr-binding forkhead associated (FHA) protein